MFTLWITLMSASYSLGTVRVTRQNCNRFDIVVTCFVLVDVE